VRHPYSGYQSIQNSPTKYNETPKILRRSSLHLHPFGSCYVFTDKRRTAMRDSQEAGIWQLIHFSLLDWLARCGQLDWSRAVMDSSSVRAVFGAGQVAGTMPSAASGFAT